MNANTYGFKGVHYCYCSHKWLDARLYGIQKFMNPHIHVLCAFELSNGTKTNRLPR